VEASGTGIPLNPGVTGVHPEVAIPPEPPEIGARSLYMAARLLAGATTFFFLSFVFAYFYLRSLNESGMFKPAHIKPEQGYGAAIVACVIVSALAAVLAGRQMKAATREGSQAAAGNWLGAAAAAVLLGLASVVLQCLAYTAQGFGPTDGGFASVYCAWTGLFALATLATMYWLETQVATELRARRAPAAERHGDIAQADRLIAPGLDAAVFYWSFLAAIGVIAWVTLYLV
jgi:heme/copper-type cytochrome/quinol oxidase subunit 3